MNNWREPSNINHINGREGIRKWKTTEEAAMAAGQKAVESTAAGTTVQATEKDLADRASEAEKEGLHSALTDLAGLLVKATETEEASERIQKEEASAERDDHSAMTGHAGLSAKATEKEEASERIQKEEALAERDDHSAMTGHAGLSAKATEREETSERERASERTQKEEASAERGEALETGLEDRLETAASETLQRRASTEKT